MRLMITLPAVFACSTFIAACVPWNCETGKGAVVKRTMEVAAFHGIAAQGSLEVRLAHGNAQHVEVEGQSNLIDLITTEVKGGVWHIGTKKCYNTDKPFVVHVTVPTIDHVIVQGSGDVKGSDSFSAQELKVEVQGSGAVDLVVAATEVDAVVQGSGDIKLKGSCGELNATVQGSGDIEAAGLIAGDVDADVQGSGDIQVNLTGKLDASVAGSGNVIYEGTPTSVDEHIAGSGEIQRAK